MLREGKIYVPKDEKLRVKIIQLHHDVLITEHRGRWKITELVMRNYWWLAVTGDVEKYVDRCNICQKMKNQTETPVEKLMVNKVPKRPWTYLMVDFITKLPLVAGKNAILVVCDRLSKIAHFVAIIEGTFLQ